MQEQETAKPGDDCSNVRRREDWEWKAENAEVVTEETGEPLQKTFCEGWEEDESRKGMLFDNWYFSLLWWEKYFKSLFKSCWHLCNGRLSE